MASYNSERFIADAIQSVLDQSLTNWELLICDDASTDKSWDIIQSFAKQNTRIKPLRLANNSGAAIARNTAIEQARGRYIAFLDSDDLWFPDKLKKQLGFMQDKNIVLSYSSYSVISEDGGGTGRIITPPTQLSYKDMLKSNQIGCLTAIYDSRLMGKVMMPLIRKRQDYGLWLSILKQGHIAQGMPDILATYRNRSGSISSNKFEMLKYHWTLYRHVEGLGRIRSAYYLMWNIIRKLTS